MIFEIDSDVMRHTLNCLASDIIVAERIYNAWSPRHHVPTLCIKTNQSSAIIMFWIVNIDHMTSCDILVGRSRSEVHYNLYFSRLSSG